MATITKIYDVFISHSASDNLIASEIAVHLESSGLETFHAGRIHPGEDISETIWQALADCRALIAVISPDMPTSAMGMIEIGAAQAWNKPIFLLLHGPSSTKLPPVFAGYPVYPLNRLQEVIRAIQTDFDPLTEEDLGFLTNVYKNLRVPVDQLSQSPQALRELTAKYHLVAKKKLPEDRLLWELLRLRKKGQLPRLSSRKSVAE